MILVSLLQVLVRAAVYLLGRSQDLLLNWLIINIHFLGITVGFHAVHILVHLFLVFMVLFLKVLVFVLVSPGVHDNLLLIGMLLMVSYIN